MIYIGKRNTEEGMFYVCVCVCIYIYIYIYIYICRGREIQTGREVFRSYCEVNTLHLLHNTRNVALYTGCLRKISK